MSVRRTAWRAVEALALGAFAIARWSIEREGADSEASAERLREELSVRTANLEELQGDIEELEAELAAERETAARATARAEDLAGQIEAMVGGRVQAAAMLAELAKMRGLGAVAGSLENVARILAGAPLAGLGGEAATRAEELAWEAAGLLCGRCNLPIEPAHPGKCPGTQWTERCRPAATLDAAAHPPGPHRLPGI